MRWIIWPLLVVSLLAFLIETNEKTKEKKVMIQQIENTDTLEIK